MEIIIIAAIGQQNELGANNELLWDLPEDMAHFKSSTSGHAVIMGRNTWDSIPSRYKPLKGRCNIVLSRQYKFCDFLGDKGQYQARSLEDAIEIARQLGFEKCFIIGGGEVYRQAFAYTSKILLTKLELTDKSADVFFPEIPSMFKQVESKPLSKVATLTTYEKK